MRMVDIIAKKRRGNILSGEEIRFFTEGYTTGAIPDYQAAALLMAVCFAGMNSDETTALTQAMAQSGETVDLSSIPGVKVDKHSTGGVGDKTTLIVGPIVADCGVPVAKMSGRGLGHTGGTIDKLESIPGYRTALDRGEFLETVHRVGISIAGQSGNLAPADKKLYALRDVTATVDCLPLIASSVMSKKLAAGADAIVLDVKAGSGAFCKTVEEASALAREMVRIGILAGRETVALVTDMDTPLGRAVGNSLEVVEAVETLRGDGPADLTALCLELAAAMLELAGKGGHGACIALAEESLRGGGALRKLRALVEAQGGDPAYIDDPARFPCAPVRHEVAAPRDGYLVRMDCEGVGLASMTLGAGRRDKESRIHHAAGILLRKKTGDAVRAGDPLATLHALDTSGIAEAEQLLLRSMDLGPAPPVRRDRILARIDRSSIPG